MHIPKGTLSTAEWCASARGSSRTPIPALAFPSRRGPWWMRRLMVTLPHEVGAAQSVVILRNPHLTIVFQMSSSAWSFSASPGRLNHPSNNLRGDWAFANSVSFASFSVAWKSLATTCSKSRFLQSHLSWPIGHSASSASISRHFCKGSWCLHMFMHQGLPWHSVIVYDQGDSHSLPDGELPHWWLMIELITATPVIKRTMIGFSWTIL